MGEKSVSEVDEAYTAIHSLESQLKESVSQLKELVDCVIAMAEEEQQGSKT